MTTVLYTRERFKDYWTAQYEIRDKPIERATAENTWPWLEITKEYAEAKISDEETGQEHARIENDRCRYCSYWRCGFGYEDGRKQREEAEGYDPWLYKYKGECMQPYVDSPVALESNSRIWSHEDFHCILHQNIDNVKEE